MENINKPMQRAMQNIMKKRKILSYSKLMEQVYNDPDINKFLNENNNYLSENSIKHSESNLYEYFQEKNKIKNGQQGLIPGYVPKLILNDGLIDITYEPNSNTIKKVKNNEIKNNIKLIHISKDVKSDSLDDFRNSSLKKYNDKTKANESRRNVSYAALDFIEKYNDTNKFYRALYLSGSFGVGKTYLLAAIGNQLADNGYKITMVHFPSFIVDVKNSIKNNGIKDQINLIQKAPILMIDDIGADAMSPWIRDDILGIILEYRMQNKLPTFFSSNLSMNELENHLTMDRYGNEEPIRAKRIMERIKFLSKEYEITGENRRIPND